MSEQQSEWSLVRSFWIDTEAYSDRDRRMFVCGVEFQMVFEAIRDKRDWMQSIHTENESRVRLMCAKLGVPVKMSTIDETWTSCEISASQLR